MASHLQVLNPVQATLDTAVVLKQISRSGNRRRLEPIVHELLQTVLPLARPKVAYLAARVTAKHGDDVEIDGFSFSGRIFAFHLSVDQEVYPFVSTCGRELEEVDVPAGDLLRRYCLDSIKGLVLASATDHLREHLAVQCGGRLARISPGELEFWPIEQQKPLFALLSGVEESIGVNLSAELTMSPVMSTSGILFRDYTFESCCLCPKRCNGRKTAYNAMMARRYRRR